MRKLATIKKIDNIVPIEGADMIELAVIGGWNVVVAKAVKHSIGDLVVYCEIDSFLPIEPEFEFLRKSSYRKMLDDEGFRLKTIRLRGQYSQGLILPLVDATEVMWRRSDIRHVLPLVLGDDVTEMLGIIKWDPPIPPELAGKAKGNFPSFLRKTDEERIQNLDEEFASWKEQDHKFYVTEKLDGSSATYYWRDGEFGVCSRNLELLETEGNSFWKVARELKLEEKLSKLGRNISLQGELIGEGIQGNRYLIKGQTVRFFNVFDIDKHERLGYPEMTNLISEVFELQMVPVCAVPGFKLPETIKGLLDLAEGKSILNDKANREGVVIRSSDNVISFKAISNKFLLKSE